MLKFLGASDGKKSSVDAFGGIYDYLERMFPRNPTVQTILHKSDDFQSCLNGIKIKDGVKLVIIFNKGDRKVTKKSTQFIFDAIKFEDIPKSVQKDQQILEFLAAVDHQYNRKHYVGVVECHGTNGFWQFDDIHSTMKKLDSTKVLTPEVFMYIVK